MYSLAALKERNSFADRLRSALETANQPTSPTAFALAYNLRAVGARVSVHGARKWIRGEAVPTQEKILVLARWLHVHAAWLRFGDAENAAYSSAPLMEDGLTTAQLALINDVISLSPPVQIVIRDLVDSFMRIAAENEDAQIERKSRTGRPLRAPPPSAL